MKTQEAFAVRLKQLREEAGLSQSELSQKLGISRGSVSFYEMGSRVPDIDTFSKIATFFEVSYDFLLGQTGSVSSDKKDELKSEVEILFNSLDKVPSGIAESLISIFSNINESLSFIYRYYPHEIDRVADSAFDVINRIASVIAEYAQSRHLLNTARDGGADDIFEALLTLSRNYNELSLLKDISATDAEKNIEICCDSLKIIESRNRDMFNDLTTTLIQNSYGYVHDQIKECVKK